jgi:hypothetical protein
MQWPGNSDTLSAADWWAQHTGGSPDMPTTARVNRLTVWGI